MSNMTVSFYSKKHHDTVASAIKARATSSIELLCRSEERRVGKEC